MISPPAALIWEIVVASTPPWSGRWPSHAGLQPPLDRMKAIVNALIPVAFITVVALGGLPQPM